MRPKRPRPPSANGWSSSSGSHRSSKRSASLPPASRTRSTRRSSSSVIRPVPSEAFSDLMPVLDSLRRGRRAATAEPYRPSCSRASTPLRRRRPRVPAQPHPRRVRPHLPTGSAEWLRSSAPCARSRTRRRTSRPVDINESIRTTLIVAANEYKYVADVETELAALPPVVCSAGDLNQVLLNLVVNAAHAIADVEWDTDERA